MSDVEHRYARTASALMRMALALLDRAGCALAAARLQQANDTVEAVPENAVMPLNPTASTGDESGHHDLQRGAGTGEGTGA